MRVLLQILIALAFVASGVVFGALNPQYVTLDFHLFHLVASLGVALLIALLAGAMMGGIAVSVGVVWPLQRRLRKARRELAGSASASSTEAKRSA